MATEVWIQESLARLESLEEERNRHESALETANDSATLRVHTQAIERLDAQIKTLYAELESASEHGENDVFDDEDGENDVSDAEDGEDNAETAPRGFVPSLYAYHTSTTRCIPNAPAKQAAAVATVALDSEPTPAPAPRPFADVPTPTAPVTGSQSVTSSAMLNAVNSRRGVRPGTRSLGWLHLTDLHQGIGGASWLCRLCSHCSSGTKIGACATMCSAAQTTLTGRRCGRPSPRTPLHALAVCLERLGFRVLLYAQAGPFMSVLLAAAAAQGDLARVVDAPEELALPSGAPASLGAQWAERIGQVGQLRRRFAEDARKLLTALPQRDGLLDAAELARAGFRLPEPDDDDLRALFDEALPVALARDLEVLRAELPLWTHAARTMLERTEGDASLTLARALLAALPDQHEALFAAWQGVLNDAQRALLSA